MLKRAKKYLADFVHIDPIDSLICNAIVLGLITILVLILRDQLANNIFLKIDVFFRICIFYNIFTIN